MRILLFASTLSLVAGCGGDFEFDLDLCPALAADCVSARQPFLFLDETPTQVALGGEAEVAYLAHDTLGGFDVVPSDPAVVTIEHRGAREFVIHSVGEGSAMIAARAADGRMFGALPISVARVTKVGFAFAPAGDEPLPRLAALSGARERLRVLPRASNGTVLHGADRLIELRVVGDLEQIDPVTAQARPGEFNFFYQDAEPGYEIAVRFGALGAGAITAQLGGTELGSIEIEVIAAASEVALRLSQPASPSAVQTDGLLVVDLVGSDARGVPVAGLVGDFTATPPELVAISSLALEPRSTGLGEALVRTQSTPGSVTITAALPDRTVSTVLAILPRPKVD